MVDTRKPIKSYVVGRKGIEKLETLSGVETKMFWELVKRYTFNCDYKCPVIIITPYHKDNIAKTLNFAKRQIVDNYMQKLLKKGVIKIVETGVFVADKSIIEDLVQ